MTQNMFSAFLRFRLFTPFPCARNAAHRKLSALGAKCKNKNREKHSLHNHFSVVIDEIHWKMKCHYEILGLSMKATDDEIKKAYRKLALQWHPDKNPDNIDESTKHFKLIQQAYDVLIDPQERAWYDRHRDAILKGGLDEHYEDNSLNLFAYFTSSCYSGYGDDEKGFYTVYRHVFETIVNEDAQFMDDQEKGIKQIPTFGISTSDYDEIVAPFYAHWQSYCTYKPYSWLDKHDIRQAPNRQILRAMEKENKKIRDAARKERNEEVRELVAFVRKRDRRVQAYRRLLAEQRLAQMKKVEEHRLNQLRTRLREIGEYKEADWHDNQAREDSLKEIEAQLAQDFGESSQSDSDDERDSNAVSEDEDGQEDSLYCAACEKTFKTAKAYQNHENSKKHKDSVKLLKLHMTEEEFRTLRLERNVEDGENEENDTSKKGKKSKRKQKAQKKAESDENEQEEIVAQEADSSKLPAMEEKETTAQGGSLSTKRSSHSADADPDTIGPKPSVCQTCSETFSSRTKLFDHLKSTGHAALKEIPSATSRKSKGGKKGKRP